MAYECPKGYFKEDIQSQLYFDDLHEDSELWLIRVPNDINPTDLENHQITLNNESEILQGNDGKYYKCDIDKCYMQNLRLVLPDKETKQLKEVNKSFKGSIQITEYELPIKIAEDDIKMELEEDGANQNLDNNIQSEPSVKTVLRSTRRSQLMQIF
ncbi:uncharacterized protein CEXT_298301 [Caerostris extrusa]|uniref:Uncharacterized protein n=1 Tax=Caerostris extrusa TaxID=172846 RepID=A0AAV4WZ10_CAEEX|nr:uncharacterized protein CEXT_298301 [Caerostris extrusa]